MTPSLLGAARASLSGNSHNSTGHDAQTPVSMKLYLCHTGLVTLSLVPAESRHTPVFAGLISNELNTETSSIMIQHKEPDLVAHK